MFRLSPEFQSQLKLHDWPGNVRELENVIRRELAMATGTTLDGQDRSLASEGANQPEEQAMRPGLTLQEVGRRLLENTLEATGGNRTRAAELMGVSLRTVRNKIREYGLASRRA